MRQKLTFGFVITVFSLACVLAIAQPPQNEPPLNKDQVMGLVRNHLGDATGAKVVEQRKIDFAPTEEFLNELRQAGAAEVFLKAVRDASPVAESPPAPAQATAGNSGGAGSAAAQPSPPPLPAAEPPTIGEVYGVTPAGTLEALDRVNMKYHKVGKAYREEKYGPLVRNASMYFEGEASSVVFKPGEAQVLAIRDTFSGGSAMQDIKEYPGGGVEWYVARLDVRGGKRFVTNLDVPLEVRSYGKPTPVPDGKKPGRLAASFQLIPRQTLPPGEYVVLIAWQKYPELRYGSIGKKEYFTFAVAGP
jgi:hypothetical protein